MRIYQTLPPADPSDHRLTIREMVTILVCGHATAVRGGGRGYAMHGPADGASRLSDGTDDDDDDDDDDEEDEEEEGGVGQPSSAGGGAVAAARKRGKREVAAYDRARSDAPCNASDGSGAGSAVSAGDAVSAGGGRSNGGLLGRVAKRFRPTLNEELIKIRWQVEAEARPRSHIHTRTHPLAQIRAARMHGGEGAAHMQRAATRHARALARQPLLSAEYARATLVLRSCLA